MDFDFDCPKCQQQLTVDDSEVGLTVDCPSCSAPIEIPVPPAATPMAPPPLPEDSPPPPAAKRVKARKVSPAPANAEPISPAPGAPVAAAPVETVVEEVFESVEIADMEDEDVEFAKSLCASVQQIRGEIAKAIVGQDEVIEQILISILARSHCLLEGVPGLAKTYIVKSMADAMHLSFHRVQFTPDLMPADITGTDVIQEDEHGRRKLVFLKGPIFAQMILADEINRSPPKTQAALLESMQEHSVTVGGETTKLEEPFFVLATQNPVEQEGTYPLPEAQKDRFMFHVKMNYPSRDQEREVIRRTTSAYKPAIDSVITAEEIVRCQEIVRKVPVPEHVTEYVLDLVCKSRPGEEGSEEFVKDLIAWGPGPRACQQLVLGGKVRAILKGRLHVTVDDIVALAHPVLRHRIVPTFTAEAEGIDVDHIIDRILESTPTGAASNVL